MTPQELESLYPRRRGSVGASYDIGVIKKSDVVTMQKVLQAIAKLSKNPVLAYTLKPGWSDGVVGRGTQKAVNIAVRAAIGKPPISIASIKTNIFKITETGLTLVKKLQVLQPAPPTPTPPAVKAAERKAAAVVEKLDSKILTATKVSSGIIPITSDIYLRKTKGGYLVEKKLPNTKILRVGTVLVYAPGTKLKIKGKAISPSTAKEIRARLPKPLNTYLITLNGRLVAKRSYEAVKNPPPPVSPYVPPSAPPDAVATDYSTNKTPAVVQKEVKPPPPKSVAPPSKVPDPIPLKVDKPEKPVVVTDPKTGRKKIILPPVTITAKGPTTKEKIAAINRMNEEARKQLSELPEISETESFLERFFAQEAIAGIGYAEPLKLTYDTRQRKIPHPSHWIPPKQQRVEILSGHDGMDDADEELAEMEASGFSKGWWD